MHDVVEPGEQDLAQCQTIHGRPDGDELIVTALGERPGASFLELTLNDAKQGNTATWLAAGGQEQVVQARL